MSLGEAGIIVYVADKRVAGWVLVEVGICVTVCSYKIVFPGLESLLGIETIVGKQNVVYFPDGGYGYTNPAAMVRWVSSVAACGLLLASIGAALLFSSPRTKTK